MITLIICIMMNCILNDIATCNAPININVNPVAGGGGGGECRQGAGI